MKKQLLRITSINQEFNKTVELQPNTENELNHLVTEGLATKEEDTYVFDYDIFFKELQKQDYQEATATPLYLFGNRIINDLRDSASTESNEQLNNLAVEVENYFHKFDFQKETYQDVDIQSGYAYNKFELRFLSLEKVEEAFNKKYNELIEEIDQQIAADNRYEDGQNKLSSKQEKLSHLTGMVTELRSKGLSDDEIQKKLDEIGFKYE